MVLVSLFLNSPPFEIPIRACANFTLIVIWNVPQDRNISLKKERIEFVIIIKVDWFQVTLTEEDLRRKYYYWVYWIEKKKIVSDFTKEKTRLVS